MPDALLGATLPLHPGLGQVPNMLACISSGAAFDAGVKREREQCNALPHEV